MQILKKNKKNNNNKSLQNKIKENMVGVRVCKYFWLLAGLAH